MDARTNIKGRLPSRHVTEGPELAPHCSHLRAARLTTQQIHQPSVSVLPCGTNAALHPQATGDEGRIEIFKKTPCVADLKPAGRYVAKDMVEFGEIRFSSSAIRRFCVRGVGPKAALGGPTARLRDGDIIEIDADVGTLNVKLTDMELTERKTKWKARETNHTSGALWKYAQQVGLAVDGAVIHPNGAHEKQCYADI